MIKYMQDFSIWSKRLMVGRRAECEVEENKGKLDPARVNRNT